MDEDKASTSKKGKDIHVGSASDIEMAEDILGKLYTDVGQKPSQQNSSEFRKSECCICRVPNQLRCVNWKAYHPLKISIGPLHRENKRLAMEKEKQKYFIKLTERDGMDKEILLGIVISIKNEEECLRHYYSDKSISMNNSDFVEMIFLDAVFIIQFFLESNDDTDGPKHFEPRMAFAIREDLMLFENQLPLFIIQDIYDRVNPRSQDAKAIPFLDLATRHFRKYSFLKRVETSPGVEGSRHFTDLLRNLMLSRDIKRSKNISNPTMLKYSSVMLRKAGVRFQGTQDKCLVNITFDKGVLNIPQLEVDRYFERVVRNIMALEQCCYSSEAYICSYIKFLDHLIDSVEDVGLLRRKGIIVNRLGDDAAVSNMINNLCENIGDINYTCFHDISVDKGLNDHFDNRFNHSIANLVLVYFPNIWRGTATVAAAILLILTFIQTISSVKSFY